MNKKAIVVLFAMFGLPVVVATLMHSQWFDWRPASTRNHGELISPVIQWPGIEVSDIGGLPVTQARLEGQWQLVYYTSTLCDAACLEALYWLRQVRLSQDRHVPEIGLMVVHEPELSDEVAREIENLSEVFLMIDGADAQALASHFPTDNQSSSRFIIDPMGNIMMRYNPDQEPDGIRKDLGRLLTWTKPQPVQ